MTSFAQVPNVHLDALIENQDIHLPLRLWAFMARNTWGRWCPVHQRHADGVCISMAHLARVLEVSRSYVHKLLHVWMRQGLLYQHDNAWSFQADFPTLIYQYNEKWGRTFVYIIFEAENSGSQTLVNTSGNQTCSLIVNSRSQIETGRSPIETGRSQIETGRSLIVNSRSQIETGRSQIENDRSQIEIQPLSKIDRLYSDHPLVDRALTEFFELIQHPRPEHDPSRTAFLSDTLDLDSLQERFELLMEFYDVSKDAVGWSFVSSFEEMLELKMLDE